MGSWLGISSSKADEPATSSKIKSSTPRPSTRDVSKFERRSQEAIEGLVKSWEPYVHPRAREFFPTQDMLLNVLSQIARSVHREEDPVLGSDEKCCYWFGEVTKDEPQQACIRLVKPGETSESTTFVNRVLVFIFATDESFEQLMRLPKEPFRMQCCDQLCINLNHISVE